MRKTVWVSPNPNWWWREHKRWKNDIDLISPREWCVERAREIARTQEEEIEKQTLLKGKWFIIWLWNSYWRDPFPPRICK